MEQSPSPTVPVFEQLQNIYQGDAKELKEKHERRFLNLRDRFKKIYECVPTFYARAPGRVNIIGEHIDYCGYSVLPAALEQDFLMAYVVVEEGEGADKIVINNIDKDTYPAIEISTDPFQKFADTASNVNYFLCGYKAILAHNEELRKKVQGKPKGLKIMIDSYVPPAAGLSSSSAFTVCTAIVTMHANGLTKEVT